MACFGGGSTISKDKANAYQEQEVKLRKLHIWFATSINRKRPFTIQTHRHSKPSNARANNIP